MEVSMLANSGLPEGCILSIRSGSIRRQAPVSSGKAFRFPDPLSNPLKFDLLMPIASGHLVTRPGQEQYKVDLGEGGDMNCEVQVKPSGPSSPANATATAPMVESKKDSSAAGAKEFLEQHAILEFVQAVLHTIITERPKDPYLEMARHFTCGYKASDKRSTPGTNWRDPYMDYRASGITRVAAAPVTATAQESREPAAEVSETRKELIPVAPAGKATGRKPVASAAKATETSAPPAEQAAEMVSARRTAEAERERLAAEAAAEEDRQQLVSARRTAEAERERLAAEAAAEEDRQRLVSARRTAEAERERLAAEAAAEEERQRLVAARRTAENEREQSTTVLKEPDGMPAEGIGQDLRLAMKFKLLAACDAGELEAHLETAITSARDASPAVVQAQTDDDLRTKMRACLLGASETGELAAALETVIPRGKEAPPA